MASKTPPPPAASAEADAPSPDEAGARGYQVLARKYRPRTFADLAGQEAMVRTLTNAFKTGRIAHAFMLTGVRGVGKTTTARLLARALNYRTDTADAPSIELDPPGEHCAAIMASQHPDVLELDAASHTGVADMRDLLDGSRYAPVSARYKVYIIDEVHMLSTAAFNALLKTLEEPPPHVKFIFATTEIRKVPVTVLSRCQRFNLQRFSPEALGDHLAKICAQEGVRIDNEALSLIARAAEGSARDALSILDQAIVQGEGEISALAVREMLGLADRSRIFDLLEHAIAGDQARALSETVALLEAGADAPVLLKDLMDIAVEISRAQAMKEDYSYAGPAEWMRRTQAMAQRLSPAQAARFWRLLLQGFEDCQRSPDPPAAAQMVVLRLAAAAFLPSPEDAARLLGQGAPADPSGGPGNSAPKRDSRSEVVAPRSRLSDQNAPRPLPPDGRILSNLRDVLAELDARRELSLRWEIERFVRPAEIRFGLFSYSAAPGAPHDLPQRLKAWLEDVCGVEWLVRESSEGARETPAEARERRHREALNAAAVHPRVASALKLFPDARLVRVETSEPDDPLADLEEDNVIQVDFQSQRDASAPPSEGDTFSGMERDAIEPGFDYGDAEQEDED